MPIESQAKKRYVEQRPGRVNSIGSIKRLQAPFIIGRGLVRSNILGRNWVYVADRNRHRRQERFFDHAIVGEPVIVRHEALIAPEPMRKGPGKPLPIKWFGKLLVKQLRRRTTGKQNRE